MKYNPDFVGFSVYIDVYQIYKKIAIKLNGKSNRLLDILQWISKIFSLDLKIDNLFINLYIFEGCFL